MRPNDAKKPKITKNWDYDENGEYDPRLPPEQRQKMLEMFNRHLTDLLPVKNSDPYLGSLKEHF